MTLKKFIAQVSTWSIGQARSLISVEGEHQSLADHWHCYSLCHKNMERGKKVNASYAHLLFDLFATYELPQESSSEQCLDICDSTLTFIPSMIDETRITPCQQNVLCAIVKIWKETPEVTLNLIIDLKCMKNEDVTRLLSSCTYSQIKTGINIWTTIPCKFQSIRVISPKSFVGWNLAASFIKRLLHPKLLNLTKFE